MTLVDKLAAFKNTAAPLRWVSKTKVLSLGFEPVELTLQL